MVSLDPPSLDLSVVVPVRDERESLDELLAELCAALERTGLRWEIILADDASEDGSGGWIESAARRDPRVRGVRLDRRGGQSAALAGGLARARGRTIVTLDADLQYDPADMPGLLAALGQADVVSGVRLARDDPPRRRLASVIANRVRRGVLGDSITDMGCSFKAYRREALVGIPAFAGMHRFLPALCQFRGARVVEVRVSHRRRRHGVSKYGVADRLGRGLYDLVGVRWLKSRLITVSAREVVP